MHASDYDLTILFSLCLLINYNTHRCLKKYCVCYQGGYECSVGRCKCVECQNPYGAISQYGSAQIATLNPTVIVPVIVSAENLKCKCTKTSCLKLYCECFRQDVVCTDKCVCLECKNTVAEEGPNGDRTKAKNEIMKTRPMVFKTAKKKSGVGCNCTRNKCLAKYCDCNARGTGCDPAVCTCVNCENMMKPLSEMMDSELQPDEPEETTEVFAVDLDTDCKIKGLENFSHLIDDLEEADRVPNPAGKLSSAYINKNSAAEVAKKVQEEEARVRSEIEGKIKLIETQVEVKIAKEYESLKDYRSETNEVMCLEMEEPCRWNSTYQQLKQYVITNGDLPQVPSACTNEADRRLSIWVQEQKSLVYSKSERIINAPHRIEALSNLGIEWIESSDERWHRMYGRLAAYKRQHGTAILPSFTQCRKSKDSNLTALRFWVDSQEKEVKSWSSDEITKRQDRLKKLQELGLPIKLSWEQEWEYYVVELLRFRSKYGHLNLTGSNDKDLQNFLSVILAKLKRGSEDKLSAEELHDLRIKGLYADLKNLIKNPVGRPSAAGKIDNTLVPLERIKEVNYWAHMLEQLKAYQTEFNTLDFLLGNRAGKYGVLRDWVELQRKCYENKTLEESRIKELTKLGLEFDPWNDMFKKLRRYKREGGTARLPKEFKSTTDGEEDAELSELCKWVQDQIKLYRKDGLDSDKKKKLRKLGVVLTKGNLGKVPWEDRFEEIVDYFQANGTCLPTRAGPLYQFVVELVELIEKGYVSTKRQKIIDQSKIAPHLKPSVVYNNKNKRKAGGGMSSGVKKLKASDLLNEEV